MFSSVNRRSYQVWQSVALWARNARVSCRFNLPQLFTQVIIIRGIGYRIYVLQNDLISTASSSLLACNNSDDNVNNWFNTMAYEFPYSRYLIIRAGHSVDLCLPIPKDLFLKVSKKDRKLVLISRSKLNLGYFAKQIIKYRYPSAYTGRGMRVKHKIQLRKTGKKDKQKGKTF